MSTHLLIPEHPELTACCGRPPGMLYVGSEFTHNPDDCTCTLTPAESDGAASAGVVLLVVFVLVVAAIIYLLVKGPHLP